MQKLIGSFQTLLYSLFLELSIYNEIQLICNVKKLLICRLEKCFAFFAFQFKHKEIVSYITVSEIPPSCYWISSFTLTYKSCVINLISNETKELCKTFFLRNVRTKLIISTAWK